MTQCMHTISQPGLPGGVYLKDQQRHDFSWRSFNGNVELSMAEDASEITCPVQQVNALLSAALAEIGGHPAHSETVQQLCVGDRHYLLRQLAARIEPQVQWLNVICGQCAEPFDISYRHADVPVKAAQAPYPKTRVETSLGLLWVRVPTGCDQLAIAQCIDEADCLPELLRRIVSQGEQGSAIDPAQLSQDDIDAIEHAVESIAPEMANHSQAQCPHCGAENQVLLDVYASLQHGSRCLYDEIHILAANYHWSEADILALPYRRRQAYLQRLEYHSARQRGEPQMADAHSGGFH